MRLKKQLEAFMKAYSIFIKIHFQSKQYYLIEQKNYIVLRLLLQKSLRNARRSNLNWSTKVYDVSKNSLSFIFTFVFIFQFDINFGFNELSFLF